MATEQTSNAGHEFTDLYVGADIDIQSHELYGRYAVAARDFEQGETVFTAVPYACTFLTEGGDVPPRSRWCACCLRFKQRKALIVCKPCGLSFCSVKCQSRAEELGIHSPFECRALECLSEEARRVNLSADSLASAALLVSVAGRAVSDATSKSAREPAMRHVSALAMLPDRLPFQQTDDFPNEDAWVAKCKEVDDEKFKIAAAAVNSLHAAGFVLPDAFHALTDATCASQGLEDMLLALHSRVCCNTFALSADMEQNGDERKTEGWGVFPACSLFNHSCMPSMYFENSSKASDRGCLRFRALHGVKKGAPLTISYNSSFSRMHAIRRANLRNFWNFECSCERCSGDATRTEVDADALVDYDRKFTCNGCSNIGPSRLGTDKGRPKGCSCFGARNRLSG